MCSVICAYPTIELSFSMYCFVSIVLFYVLFVCKYVLLPLGFNQIAVKYIISYHHYVLQLASLYILYIIRS